MFFVKHGCFAGGILLWFNGNLNPKNKTHTLKEWETDLSSQTGASQAGILHGNNKDIIAYRWVEKENNNKIIVSSNFSHAPLIEQKISDGNGLLSDKGASRANMFSGDSDDFIFTSSKIIELNKLYNKTWYSVFTTSNSFQRIFVLFELSVKHTLSDFLLPYRCHKGLSNGKNLFYGIFQVCEFTQTLFQDYQYLHYPFYC